MAVSFFPFNSIVVNGVADRAANAENLAAYLAGFFSDGVIMDEDTALQVSVDSGMQLQILAGTGVINGKTILNTTAASITIDAASATLKRIDRVIFRLDENNRLMEFDVLKGTAASSPTAPALTRSGGIYEMCLAEVLVPAGATSILASYITDTRSDSSKCGIASIPPHMQDIAHGGTGATTAANAAKALGVGDYCYIKISSDTGTYPTTATKVTTLTISSQQGGYFTDNGDSTFKVNKACKIKTSGTIQLNPAASGTAVGLIVNLRKGNTDVSCCRVMMDTTGGRSTEAFGESVISLKANDVLSFYANATTANKLKLGGETRFIFEVLPA